MYGEVDDLQRCRCGRGGRRCWVAICSARRQSIGDSAVATTTGLLFPVPLRGELRGGDLLEIATDQTDNGQDRNSEQDDAEPEVEDDRCHAGQRSERPFGRELGSLAGSADAAVAVEVFVEALLDPRQQAGRHFVVAALGRDDCAKFGLEVECLQTVGASVEVSMDRVMAVLRQGAVEKGLELADRFVAVIHWSVLSSVLVVACRDEAALLGKVVQLLLHRFSSPMQPRHHGTDRHVDHFGDLLVRKSFDIGEQDGNPECFRQLFERGLHLVVGEQFEQRVFGAAARRAEVADPAVQVEILDIVEVGLDAGDAAWRGRC